MDEKTKNTMIAMLCTDASDIQTLKKKAEIVGQLNVMMARGQIDDDYLIKLRRVFGRDYVDEAKTSQPELSPELKAALDFANRED